jgi:urease accessory protein
MDSLLRLLTWLSPAFPIGGFAYSAGLEWAVEAGTVTNEATLTAWLQDALAHGALRTDAILLRLAHQGADVSELGITLATTAERRAETTAQGSAFILAAAAWPGADWSETATPYPAAVGKLAAAHNIPEDDTALSYLHAATAAQISAAIRLIPLGQAAGLRVQAALEPAILETLAETQGAGLDSLGTAAWGADIAAMRHETQYTRLFRS